MDLIKLNKEYEAIFEKNKNSFVSPYELDPILEALEKMMYDENGEIINNNKLLTQICALESQVISLRIKLYEN